MNKNFKKGISGILLSVVLLTGCTTTSSEIVKAQNQEVIQLQKIRAEILARPTRTTKERLAKRADLKEINLQIEQSMKTAQEAQSMSNQQVTNTIGAAFTGVGAVLGTAATIHHITK